MCCCRLVTGRSECGIETSHQPLPLPNTIGASDDIGSAILAGFGVSYIVGFGMAFMIATFVVFFIAVSECGVRGSKTGWVVGVGRWGGG